LAVAPASPVVRRILGIDPGLRGRFWLRPLADARLTFALRAYVSLRRNPSP